jgi:hypothetical protein
MSHSKKHSEQASHIPIEQERKTNICKFVSIQNVSGKCQTQVATRQIIDKQSSLSPRKYATENCITPLCLPRHATQAIKQGSGNVRPICNLKRIINNVQLIKNSHKKCNIFKIANATHNKYRLFY